MNCHLSYENTVFQECEEYPDVSAWTQVLTTAQDDSRTRHSSAPHPWSSHSSHVPLEHSGKRTVGWIWKYRWTCPFTVTGTSFGAFTDTVTRLGWLSGTRKTSSRLEHVSLSFSWFSNSIHLKYPPKICTKAPAAALWQCRTFSLKENTIFTLHLLTDHIELPRCVNSSAPRRTHEIQDPLNYLFCITDWWSHLMTLDLTLFLCLLQKLVSATWQLNHFSGLPTIKVKVPS